MENELRVIIAGGRDFNDYNKAEKCIDDFLVSNNLPVKIISGNASGADRMGELYGNLHGIDVVQFPAEWNKYGRAAGPIRNRKMAEYAAEERGVLIAFWDGKSRGTKNMIENAKRSGLEISIVNY